MWGGVGSRSDAQTAGAADGSTDRTSPFRFKIGAVAPVVIRRPHANRREVP